MSLKPPVYQGAANRILAPKSCVGAVSGKGLFRARNRFHRDLHQAQIRVGDFFECRASEVDDSALVDKSFCRSAIRDSNQNAARFEIRGRNSHTDSRAQRIKPRSRSELVGIKLMAVGHQLAAML